VAEVVTGFDRLIRNVNEIAEGKKKIETDVSITKMSLIFLLITLVLSFTIIYGIKKAMKA